MKICKFCVYRFLLADKLVWAYSYFSAMGQILCEPWCCWCQGSCALWFMLLIVCQFMHTYLCMCDTVQLMMAVLMVMMMLHACRQWSCCWWYSTVALVAWLLATVDSVLSVSLLTSCQCSSSLTGLLLLAPGSQSLLVYTVFTWRAKGVWHMHEHPSGSGPNFCF